MHMILQAYVGEGEHLPASHNRGHSVTSSRIKLESVTDLFLYC